MTSRPMADVDQSNAPSELGLKRAREQVNSKSALASQSSKTPSSNTPLDTHSVADDGSDVTARLMVALQWRNKWISPKSVLGNWV